MPSNSPKYRDYFITINKGAPCYEHVHEIVKEMNTKLWAWIVHDKDILTEVDPEDGTITEKPKSVHKHLVVEVKNPVSFNSIQNKFEGAHIDVIKYKRSTYQYLLHNSPRSKEKYQYALGEIVSNDLEAVKNIIESEELETFKENLFLQYIAEGTDTPYRFVKRFGLTAYKQYWKPYNEMLNASRSDPEMIDDLKCQESRLEDDLPF